MKHLFPLMLASMLITGCTTTRYLRVACITPEQLEELKRAKPEAIRDKLTGKADEDLKLVAGKLIRVEAYASGLIDILGNCTG